VEDAFQFSNSQFKAWYNSQEIAAIQNQRKKMHGVLFFDKALAFAKINGNVHLTIKTVTTPKG
jgi:NOL1/NOP2/fmu family ribosome biogenesis protein